MANLVSGYTFKPDDLDSAGRKPGISAFMRIRNGADFLEATIRSHISFFDEIVAVYNQCTDQTPDILERLAAEFGEKIRVFHYTDRVFPPGSEGHARTLANAPGSMVNYSNFALCKTTRRFVTKLDDDHLAIPDAINHILSLIAARPNDASTMYSFSGLNLMRNADGRLAIPASDPISGSGDIGFFPVSADTFFTHDRRFERVPRKGLVRRFAGFTYWHLKYLKSGLGFDNYELDQNPESRFAARQAAFAGQQVRGLTLKALKTSIDTGPLLALRASLHTKSRLLLERNRALKSQWPGMTLDEALASSTDPAFLRQTGLSWNSRAP